MIKSVPHLSGEIMTMIDQRKPWSEIDKLIKQWGESIIDECAGNFECTMEVTDSTGSGATKIDIETPVLVRTTIFDVKKQL